MTNEQVDQVAKWANNIGSKASFVADLPRGTIRLRVTRMRASGELITSHADITDIQPWTDIGMMLSDVEGMIKRESERLYP